MALLQCGVFKKYPLKLVEDKDTAETARRIQEGNIKGIAAIASNTAAKCIVTILVQIQTINHNMTRFVILEKQNSFTARNK
jgi:prephenate dehydratase